MCRDLKDDYNPYKKNYDKANLILLVVMEASARVIGLKGTVMQTEKALINDRVYVSKVSWKFCIRKICNSVVIRPWIMLFLKNVPYFITVSIVFVVYK